MGVYIPKLNVTRPLTSSVMFSGQLALIRADEIILELCLGEQMSCNLEKIEYT